MTANAPTRYRYSRQRLYRRYDLHYPVALLVAVANTMLEIKAISCNVSAGGMLVHSHKVIPALTAVRVTMQIDGQPIVRPIRLITHGSIVRLARAEDGFVMAIECSRPMWQMEAYLLKPTVR